MWRCPLAPPGPKCTSPVLPPVASAWNPGWTFRWEGGRPACLPSSPPLACWHFEDMVPPSGPLSPNLFWVPGQAGDLGQAGGPGSGRGSRSGWGPGSGGGEGGAPGAVIVPLGLARPTLVLCRPRAVGGLGGNGRGFAKGLACVGGTRGRRLYPPQLSPVTSLWGHPGRPRLLTAPSSPRGLPRAACVPCSASVSPSVKRE